MNELPDTAAQNSELTNFVGVVGGVDEARHHLGADLLGAERHGHAERRALHLEAHLPLGGRERVRVHGGQGLAAGLNRRTCDWSLS